MPRQTSTMTISLPEDLKQFVKKRSVNAHYGTPSDYIRGLIREDLKRLEEERLEAELLKGLKSGKGIPMTKDAGQSAHHNRHDFPFSSYPAGLAGCARYH